MLKKLAIAVVALIVIVVVVGLMLPQDYGMSRSTTISAPVDVIYDQVADLKKNEAWSPWAAQDPTMKVTYAGGPGVGSSYSWTSEDMGGGTLTIAKLEPNKRIENTLEFAGQGTGEGIWEFEPAGDDVKVTWSMNGKAEGVMDRYFGLMIDGMVGPSFEDGLARLKKVAEAVPTSTTAL